MVVGFKFKEKIECFHCHDDFIKGTGHKMLCHDCNVVRPLCDKCYQHLLKDGVIEDVKYDKNQISKRGRENLR